MHAVVLSRGQAILLYSFALLFLIVGYITTKIAMRHADPRYRVTWNPKTWENSWRLRDAYPETRWFWCAVAGYQIRNLGMLLCVIGSFLHP